MITYNFGEVVLVDFPQTGSLEIKRRPALLILDIGDDDVVLAPITTKERRGVGDLKLIDWRSAALLRESWVRLAKIGRFAKQDIQRKLGVLNKTDKVMVSKLWGEVYKFDEIE